MTMTFDEFVKKYKGKGIDFDKAYDVQCFAWRTSSTEMLSAAVCSQVCMLDKSTKIRQAGGQGLFYQN